MKNKFFLLTFGVLLISLTSATDYNVYSGDTINLTLDKSYAYYSVVGNSSEILLNISQEGNNVLITFDKYMQDDSFEIVFFDLEKEVITIIESSGGCNKCSKARTIYDTIIKEIPKYITEWKDNEIIDLENKNTDTKDIESKLPWWIYLILLLCIFEIVCIVIIVNRTPKLNSKENNIVERRLRKDEKIK